jgi:predicted nucleic acid-binding protein
VYVLDTNVYITTFHDPAFADRVASFIERASRPFAVSSVVLAELLIGLTSDARREQLVREVYAVADPNRVITPAHEDWILAGDALCRLGGEALSPRRSFWNDLLLAASCARSGCTLITRDTGDFGRIATHIPVAAIVIE